MILLIKINDNEKRLSFTATKIVVTLENNEEKTLDSYPITINPKDIKPMIYEVKNLPR